MLRQACGVQSHDRVLDIGCGAGQTTREAARAAHSGSALGVDVSTPAIERARELARAEGLYRFPQERFDLAMSRFGTMFFDDPVAAFANISRALRPAGRVVMMHRRSTEAAGSHRRGTCTRSAAYGARRAPQ